MKRSSTHASGNVLRARSLAIVVLMWRVFVFERLGFARARLNLCASKSHIVQTLWLPEPPLALSLPRNVKRELNGFEHNADCFVVYLVTRSAYSIVCSLCSTASNVEHIYGVCSIVFVRVYVFGVRME